MFPHENPGGRKPGLLNIPKVPVRPMQKIHIDHVGPFIKSEQGNMHILVIVDALTRFVKLYPSETTNATETVDHVEKFVTGFGAPDILISDRGTAFTSSLFKEFCEKYCITHRLIASHYPQANSLAEKQMRAIVPLIVASLSVEEQWDEKLDVVERNLNCAMNKITGFSPFEMLYGYQPTFEDSILAHLTRRTDENLPRRDNIREEAKENIKREQQKYKAYYDKKKYQAVKYQIGDIVAIQTLPTQTGQPTKT